MNITKEVITDLYPLYVGNECSADSRTLIEQYLRANPGEAEELRRIMTAVIPVASKPAPGLDEVRTLREARQRVRRQSWLVGIAIFFSLLPFSFLWTSTRTYWLLLEAPKTALTYGVVGIGCWIVYGIVRRSNALK